MKNATKLTCVYLNLDTQKLCKSTQELADQICEFGEGVVRDFVHEAYEIVLIAGSKNDFTKDYAMTVFREVVNPFEPKNWSPEFRQRVAKMDTALAKIFSPNLHTRF